MNRSSFTTATFPRPAVSARSCIAVALLALVAGCTDSSSSQQSAKQPVEASSTSVADGGQASASFPRTLTDCLGRTITLQQPPQRIVSLAPKNTELVFAIGAGSQVVGVTTYCNYPPEAEKIYKIGGFSSHSISLERVAALQPDLVLSAGALHSPVIEHLESLGLPVLALGADSLNELRAEMELLGQATGRESQARRLLVELDERIARTRQTTETIPAEERVTVFYHVWGEPLMAAGPASYLGEMIEICGGVNIVEDAQARYPNISLEVLVARDPDVILSSSEGHARWKDETLLSRPGWSGLKAVHNRRICLLDADLVSRCGPRLVDALEVMAHALYPQYFPKPAGSGGEAISRNRVP